MLENRLKLSLVALLAAAGASPSPKSPLPWFEAGKVSSYDTLVLV